MCKRLNRFAECPNRRTDHQGNPFFTARGGHDRETRFISTQKYFIARLRNGFANI
jgi:hypothetical protein